MVYESFILLLPNVGSWYNSTHSHMCSSLAKHLVLRLSSKRVRQIEIHSLGSMHVHARAQKYVTDIPAECNG